MKRVCIGIFSILLLFFFFTGCGSKKKTVETVPPTKEEKVDRVEEPVSKVEREELSEEELFQRKSLEELNREGNLKMIQFDFDKYQIRDDMKGLLQANGDWLMNHSTVQIMVEGHCDERGTVEYNMALGEKRAEAAKKYLLSLGVATERIGVISYGKNRPLVQGIDETSYFKNRRDEFIITKK